MKLLIASTTWLALSAAIWSPCSVFAQTDAGRTAETKQAPGKLPDSDGDGIPDRDDPHPFIADITGVSWRISPLSLGWKADSSLEEHVSTLDQHEKEILRRKQFTFGGQADTSASVESGGRGELSANPLKLFGLRDSEAHVAYGARFGVSGNVGWSQTDQETAKTLLHAVRQTQVAQRLSDLNLEFTVRFFNQSDQAFVGRKLEIPIKVGDQVVAFAQPVGANGPDLEFSIPAGREHGIPIRFRAKLDTTQSLLLLQVMQDRSPDITIEESQGEIVGEVNGRRIDAISTLSQIRRKTCLFTVELDGREFSWSVARRDDKTGRRLHLSDLFDQVNAMAVPEDGGTHVVFQSSGHYLRSALGRDNSLWPLRWWVIADGKHEVTGRDVDLSEELPQQIRLRSQFGFPKAMSHWIKNVDYKDPWSLLVAGQLLVTGTGRSALEQKKGVELFRKAADLGDASGLFALGKAYWFGTGGVVKDEKKAVELYKKAAVLGDTYSMNNLGCAYQKGEGGLAKDEKKAVELFEKAADKGNAIAMANLGGVYLDGQLGLLKDEKKAVEFYRKAADLGNPKATFNLGWAYSSGQWGLTRDEKKAVELFVKAADLGDANAMTYLGNAYQSGQGGLTQDEKKAVELYRKAADLGDAHAMTNLGMAYMFGEGGLARDEKKAVELYQKASDLGYPFGMLKLGSAYHEGCGGLAKDGKKSLDLYRKAADLGETFAIVLVGIAYLEGEGGLAKNETKAVELFQKSAALGEPSGIANLGGAYLIGQGGLIKDEKKAVELYQKASDFGNPVGMKSLAYCYENGLGGLPIDKARAAALRAQAEKSKHNR
jgi:TPR repeat protein